MIPLRSRILRCAVSGRYSTARETAIAGARAAVASAHPVPDARRHERGPGPGWLSPTGASVVSEPSVSVGAFEDADHRSGRPPLLGNEQLVVHGVGIAAVASQCRRMAAVTMGSRMKARTSRTMLPTRFFGALGHGTWAHPEDHANAIFIDLDTAHKGPDDLALGLPVSALKSFPHHCSEVFESADDEAEFTSKGFLAAQLARLLRKSLQAFLHALDPGLEFRLVEDSIGVTVDQARDATTQLAQLRFRMC